MFYFRQRIPLSSHCLISRPEVKVLDHQQPRALCRIMSPPKMTTFNCLLYNFWVDGNKTSAVDGGVDSDQADLLVPEELPPVHLLGGNLRVSELRGGEDDNAAVAEVHRVPQIPCVPRAHDDLVSVRSDAVEPHVDVHVLDVLASLKVPHLHSVVPVQYKGVWLDVDEHVRVAMDYL